MAFRLVSGKYKTIHLPKKASTAFANGDMVYSDGSGAVQPADATSGDHLGIMQKTVTSTDADYASTPEVELIVPLDETIFEVSVGNGTFTSAMVGGRYDLYDAGSIDVSATSKKVVTIVGYKDATHALVKINAMVSNADVATS